MITKVYEVYEYHEGGSLFLGKQNNRDSACDQALNHYIRSGAVTFVDLVTRKNDQIEAVRNVAWYDNAQEEL